MNARVPTFAMIEHLVVIVAWSSMTIGVKS